MASLSRGCKLRITVVSIAVEDDCYANIFVRGEGVRGRWRGADKLHYGRCGSGECKKVFRLQDRDREHDFKAQM